VAPSKMSCIDQAAYLMHELVRSFRSVLPFTYYHTPSVNPL
jgi:hypothetical protein